MSLQEIYSDDLASQESEIELLARQTDIPFETVLRIYNFERAKLEQIARIKTYVPVLIRRRVKELLQSQRAALTSTAVFN